MSPDRIATIPNALTLLRLLALPVFVLLTVRHAWLAALVVLLGIAISDILDGYLARRLRQVSRLGAALDPVVDRLTLMTVSLTLFSVGVLPALLVVLLVTRDLLIALLVLAVFRGKLPIPVTRTAKLATAGLMFGIPAFLLGRSGIVGGDAIRACAVLLTGAGTGLYYLGLLQYGAAGLRRRRLQ